MQESSARRPHPPPGTFLVVTTGRCAWDPVDGGWGRHSIPHGAWGGPRSRRDPASPVGGAGCRRCRSPTARPAAAPRVSFTEETPQRGGPSRSPAPRARRWASPLLPRASLGSSRWPFAPSVTRGCSHQGGRCLSALRPLLSPLGQLVPRCLACNTPGSLSWMPPHLDQEAPRTTRPES